MGGSKAVVAALTLAIAGGTGYWLWVDKQKKDERRAMAALLGDTTTQLRAALARPPSADLYTRLDGNLKAARAPHDRALAEAAGLYIQGAREIARHRLDAERLTREAAMSRRALAMHMSAASRRDTYWIRVANDLKKRVERDHFELNVSLKAISELLSSWPETHKQLAPHVDAALLLEEGERREARTRVEEAAKRAADELDKVRRLALPR
jgi:hypothetical protein